MRYKKLMPLLLIPFATGCVGWPGSEGVCPIRPIYSEADVENMSDELAEYLLAVELQGEKMGCWDLEE